jgi:isoquinoline 1-oxidoreductase alpha subunit
MANITVNGTRHQIDVEPETPLLWVLREELGLTGTKFGCGIAQCGACTVHVNGEAIRSCSVPVRTVEGKQITTIEGLSANSTHPVQQAWLIEQVPQCGYCQSGQIMQAAALLKQNPKPSRAQIVEHMTGNICRCGTYNRIVAAIQSVGRA